MIERAKRNVRKAVAFKLLVVVMIDGSLKMI